MENVLGVGDCECWGGTEIGAGLCVWCVCVCVCVQNSMRAYAKQKASRVCVCVVWRCDTRDVRSRQTLEC